MKAALLKVFRALPFAFLALVLTANAAALVGDMSGCGASQQETTLKAALVTADTGRAAFLAYDAKHQADIIHAATTHADGELALAAWRKEQSMAVQIIGTAYRAIAVYATLKDDPTSKQNLESALGMLASELAALGVHL